MLFKSKKFKKLEEENANLKKVTVIMHTALYDILANETDCPNATVKRMVNISKEAITESSSVFGVTKTFTVKAK